MGAAALVAAMLWAPLSMAQHPGEPNRAGHPTEQAYPGQQVGQTSPPGAETLAGPVNEGDRHENLKKGSWPLTSSAAFWQAVFSGLLLVVTLIQIRIIRDQQNATRQQLRAYLHLVVTPQTTYLFEGGEVMKARVFVRNSGQTPGRNVVVSGNVALSKTSEGTVALPPTSRADDSPPTSIHPGEQYEYLFSSDDRLPIEHARGLLEEGGQSEVTMYGRISYKDVFGRARYTNFKFRTGDPDGPGRHVMTSTEDGNDAD